MGDIVLIKVMVARTSRYKYKIFKSFAFSTVLYTESSVRALYKISRATFVHLNFIRIYISMFYTKYIYVLIIYYVVCYNYHIQLFSYLCTGTVYYVCIMPQTLFLQV